jgi:hypothetical protein
VLTANCFLRRFYAGKARPMTVEVSPIEIDALVKRSYIAPEKRQDWSEVQDAVRAFLSDQLVTP